jgi:PEP-CTERM motif
MTIKFRSAIVLSSLLFVLSLHPAAKADMIHVVAQTDTALCATVGPSCTPISFTADFTVTPPAFSPFTPAQVNFVESMTGTLNGLPATGGPGQRSWLIPINKGTYINYLPVFADIAFTSGGVQYDVALDDQLGGVVLSTPTSVITRLTWIGTLVSTPEPSSLLLLLFGTGAILVGFALVKNKPCSC